jgi:hypothetical protein
VRKKPVSHVVLVAGLILLCSSVMVNAQTVANPPTATESVDESKLPDQKKSLTEVNKELTNPISSIWSITFQENTYWLNMPTGHSDRNQVSGTFQPVLPVALTDNWDLISRPVIPVFDSTPYLNNGGNFHRVTGFGDTVFDHHAVTDGEIGRTLVARCGTHIHFPNRQ